MINENKSGENMKKYSIALVVIVLIIISFFLIQALKSEKKTVVQIGIYSGNEWGVPQIDVYRIYDEAIKLFEKENPGVSVEYRSGTLMEDYSEWLAQRILIGNEPDVFIVLGEDFDTLSYIGMLEPLDTYIEDDPNFHPEDFYKKGIEAGVYDGYQYAMPFQIVPTFMIVNETLLKDNNLAIPNMDWTVGEFLRMCETLTQDTNQDGMNDQYGVVGYGWENTYYAAKGTFEAGEKAIDVYDEEKLRKAIEVSKALYTQNSGQIVPPYAFDQGLVGFKTFSLAEFRAYKPYPYKVKKYSDFIWEPISFPGVDQETSIGKLYTVQWGMSSRSKNKDLAWAFIKFMSNDDAVQQMVWDYTYTLPTKISVTNQALSQDDLMNNVLDSAFLKLVIDQSVIEPTFKKYQKLIESMDTRIKVNIMDDKSMQEILRSVREEADSILESEH
ncbi:ABC transporter substrate-binding protein [Petrocella sp. FN5]|uniref:ABC transporter substrate-binding protein n=1 Tax=Petrocella sp. FN5 TaxID=3032002 RepID=UPI0023DC7E5F|nr:extracellular solute-binding protein [Petrocella sp. FN5]MDF1618540.1 extracellular solute-binding protein [Petrocella sp. FN5]